MSYTKTNWINGETPINATNLNNIENGIETLETTVNGIVESVNNGDNYYVKYADGTLIQAFKFSINATLTGAFGSWYESHVNLPNFPIPFNSLKSVNLTPLTMACWIEYVQPSPTGLGNGFIARPVSTPESQYNFYCTAIGTWK